LDQATRDEATREKEQGKRASVASVQFFKTLLPTGTKWESASYFWHGTTSTNFIIHAKRVFFLEKKKQTFEFCSGWAEPGLDRKGKKTSILFDLASTTGQVHGSCRRRQAGPAGPVRIFCGHRTGFTWPMAIG
jgi:hypothetical protein